MKDEILDELILKHLDLNGLERLEGFKCFDHTLSGLSQRPLSLRSIEIFKLFLEQVKKPFVHAALYLSQNGFLGLQWEDKRSDEQELVFNSLDFHPSKIRYYLGYEKKEGVYTKKNINKLINKIDNI